ncbi:MAG: ATP-dependent Clp protease ATP-binding subunit, partial [Chloroflexi bacterium]|nr:ATP-dependent Clp protease ATP-binding subunit [Chloroflexota bacterium]
MVFKQKDFTEQAQEAIGASYDVVRRFKHPQWDVEHVVLAVLEIESSVPAQLLEKLGVDVKRVKEDIEQVLKDTPKVNVQGPQIHPTPRAQELLLNAKEEKLRLHDDYIGTEHLFIAAISDERGDTARILLKYGVDKERIYQALQEVRGTHRVDTPNAENRYQALDKYTIDLTELARQGRLDPVIGRSFEIRRVMQTLTRR